MKILLYLMILTVMVSSLYAQQADSTNILHFLGVKPEGLYIPPDVKIKYCKIKILSIPSKVKVFWNSDSLGRTPIENQCYPEGYYEMKLKPDTLYCDTILNVEVNKDTINIFKIKLKKKKT